MKNIVIAASIIFIITCAIVFNVQNKNTYSNADFLRIHVRANSNSEEDQYIKYEMKDLALKTLTPFFADASTKEEVVEVIENKASLVESEINNALLERGFEYACNIKINNEYFPTRSYNSLVLESGFYDAIVIELGTANGDNWWCVAYPPLCFVAEENDTGSIVYKWKLKEIIEDFFN